jgi:lysine-specific demethylase 3
VIECETEAIRETSVGGFFEQFKDPEQRSKKGVWKLKVSSLAHELLNSKQADSQDWPSTNDFQSAYPDLYNDFCDSLPVPDFTRREGVLNLYSHVRISIS